MAFAIYAMPAVCRCANPAVSHGEAQPYAETFPYPTHSMDPEHSQRKGEPKPALSNSGDLLLAAGNGDNHFFERREQGSQGTGEQASQGARVDGDDRGAPPIDRQRERARQGDGPFHDRVPIPDVDRMLGEAGIEPQVLDQGHGFDQSQRDETHPFGEFGDAIGVTARDLELAHVKFLLLPSRGHR